MYSIHTKHVDLPLYQQDREMTELSFKSQYIFSQKYFERLAQNSVEKGTKASNGASIYCQ